MAMLMLVTGISFTSCEKEPDLSTDQFVSGEVTLLAYGPSPVARGGQLRFVGIGMDQIQSVTIEGCGEITEIERVSSEEIRITVPQTAQPCYPVLKTKAGAEIVAKTRLTYTEPVGFAAESAMTPNPVKPGQTLTIKGEYLNLVQKIIFSNKVEVVVDAEKRTREQIEVVVPAEAQTGKVTLSFCATGDTIPNEILSAEVLNVVLPSVAAIKELKEVKPGDEVVIEGKDFDLITKLYATSGEEIAEFVITDTKLSFKLPEKIVDGIIKVEAASGIQVPVASIGVALPKVSSVEGTTDVRTGDIITINGKDFEVASNVTFTAAGGKTVDADFEEGKTATQLKVKVPAGAITGSFVINTTADATIENELLAITTLKPVFAAFNPTSAPMGADVTVEGQNMDLVVKVTVTGGAELEAKNAVPASVLFTLPYANAETGTVTLHMANGESVVTSASLEVTAPECCYVTAWPELIEGEPYLAGCLLCLEVENRDVLTNVQVDNIECGFVTNGANKVYISTPESAGKKSHIKLISSNGEIDYAYEFKPNSEITTIIWKGTAVADDWGNQPFIGSDGGAEFAGVVAGDELRFYITPTADDWKLQIVEGHWGPAYASFCAVGSDTENGKFTEVDLAANGGYLVLTVTQAMIDAALTQQWWGGIFLLNGDNVICSKVVSVHHVAVEETLWSGELIADDWGNQPYALSDGGAEFTAFDVHAGQTVYFYITPLDADWKVEILEGHWGPSYAAFCVVGSDTENGKFTEVDLAANGGKVGFTLTADMITAALTSQGWGGVFVLNGDNVKVTKITVL